MREVFTVLNTHSRGVTQYIIMCVCVCVCVQGVHDVYQASRWVLGSVDSKNKQNQGVCHSNTCCTKSCDQGQNL